MIYPMAAMVLLTFIVGCLAVKTRFASVKSGQVKARYYKLMQGQSVPEMVTKTTRCFNNMFEIPLLFYVAATLHISLGIDSMSGIICAWLFVAFRYLHAFVHLTYNHILHRMLMFWGAFLAAMALWINLLVLQP